MFREDIAQRVPEEHQTVQELKKQVSELSTRLQEVSAQVQLNKPAPQTVSNDQYN